jgi:branched-chain amino acid aminotransferase
MSNPDHAWLDGLVKWEDATCHVSSLAFKYGAAVFEGVRAYWDAEREVLNIWQLDEHLKRLEYSQRFMRYERIIAADECRDAIVALLKANGFRSNVHITVTAFLSGPGQPFICAPVSLAVTAMARGDYATDGLDVQVSSWRRTPDSSLPQRVKATGNYLNGRVAAVQAKADGYDTALMLTQSGKVSEGPAMCFFMVRDGVAITADKTSDILESITRSTVITLLGEAGIPVEERPIDRSELAAADEAFFCGTAWEIAPVRSIDRLTLPAGSPGPFTKLLQERFSALTTGADNAHPEWRTAVEIAK